MTEYRRLAERLDAREVILLDGAVGTQLQSMGVPINHMAWAATALHSHPFTVRRMHEDYIAAGVDVITVNTYSAARHNLEPIGLGELTTELNLRAVMLAQDARDRAAKERPVWIAGSVSNYGLRVGVERDAAGYGHFQERTETTEAQARAYLREQAEILAEAGVDLLLAESTGGSVHRKWVLEACLATGLPVWAGFKCRQEGEGGEVKVGYHADESLAARFDEVVALGGEVVTIFHSPIAATSAALPIVQAKWKGPLGVYPEAERTDYIEAHRDPHQVTRVTPQDYVGVARQWVEQGVQIIGGCCGIELEHIRPLREALPSHVPVPG